MLGQSQEDGWLAEAVRSDLHHRPIDIQARRKRLPNTARDSPENVRYPRTSQQSQRQSAHTPSTADVCGSVNRASTVPYGPLPYILYIARDSECNILHPVAVHGQVFMDLSLRRPFTTRSLAQETVF
ncbi:hypothetical protein PDIDSM_7680 [Penicillium digitatum]|nr:hypothetical protein PDIDSM_7680 [Penicillium digitatum]